MSIQTVLIKNIVTDANTQQRKVNPAIVAEYAERKTDGADFPPVEIFSDGKGLYMWDGWHRMFAAIKLNKTSMQANVEKGTQRDAIFASLAANKTNGLQRAKGIKEHCILVALKDEEWSKMSNRDLAKHIGVSHTLVNDFRKKVVSGHSTPKSLETTFHPQSNAESPTKPIPDKGYIVDTEVKAKTKLPAGKPPQKDSLGQTVPAHLIEIFTRISEIRETHKTLTDIHKKIKDAIAADDPLYCFVKTTHLDAAMKNLKEILRFAMPYAVCPMCGGDKHNDSCRQCRVGDKSRGYLNERLYLTVDPKMKVKK